MKEELEIIRSLVLVLITMRSMADIEAKPRKTRIAFEDLALATTTSTATTVIANDAVLSSDPKRHAVLSPQPEEKKPAALDDSRRLFQRLWTDEDEIELLQGFLDYTTIRGNKGSHHGQNDAALFYDQIKSKLQLDFCSSLAPSSSPPTPTTKNQRPFTHFINHNECNKHETKWEKKL